MMNQLPQERLQIAVGAQAVAAIEAVVEMCLDYARTREAFGRPIGKFQHNRFLIAEMSTEARVARAFLDDCVRRHLDGALTAVDAAMIKWWATELQNKIVNQGVQLHGGYGYSVCSAKYRERLAITPTTAAVIAVRAADRRRLPRRRST